MKKLVNKLKDTLSVFHSNKGFTLLELLVVVLIIGILAGIALPQYQMAVAKSRFATLKNNVHVIKSALDRYYLAHDNYTSNLTALDIELKGSLSNGKSQVNLSDDSVCYISVDSIFCDRKIFGVTMEYSYNYKYKINKRYCVASSQNSNDRPNRLCQNETGRSTGSELGHWTMYQY